MILEKWVAFLKMYFVPSLMNYFCVYFSSPNWVFQVPQIVQNGQINRLASSTAEQFAMKEKFGQFLFYLIKFVAPTTDSLIKLTRVKKMK